MKVNYIKPNDRTIGLGVPYPPSDSADRNNIGYYDLKRFPEKIEIFPELKGWEELKGLIVVANKNDCIFRTLGCEVASSKFKDQKFRHKVTSYLGVAFEILDWNSTENFHQLYEEFCHFAKTQVVAQNNIVEFAPLPTSYREHALTTWSVDIWNHGFGKNEKEARSNWRSGIHVIKAFVLDQTRKYGGELSKDRKKIGDVIT